MIDAADFEELRPYLFSIAYRMLARAGEAEDVVQDAWLRAAKAPPDMRSPRAWLATVVTRLCLDRLKSAQATREEYVGPWLPEPVPTAGPAGPEESVMRQESITLAFLVLLETLTPQERAAFVLREVFDYAYDEVAAILETTEPACRQLVHRAKARLAERRPRFPAARERQREIVARFLAAAEQGDLGGLQDLLARDAVFTGDGGGKVAAALRPVTGAEAVARLFAGLWRKGAEIAARSAAPWRLETREVNGEPALLVFDGERLDSVFVFSVDDDRVTAVHGLRNPDKLAWMERSAARPSTPPTDRSA
jgi:RNA polymerase sigma-70 factor (TIGR02957 family)